MEKWIGPEPRGMDGADRFFLVVVTAIMLLILGGIVLALVV